MFPSHDLTVKALALHGLGLSVYAGEDLLDTNPVVTKKQLINLEIEDENWQKVITWIIDNKEQGLKKLINTLSKKYNVKPTIVDELSKYVKS